MARRAAAAVADANATGWETGWAQVGGELPDDEPPPSLQGSTPGSARRRSSRRLTSAFAESAYANAEQSIVNDQLDEPEPDIQPVVEATVLGVDEPEPEVEWPVLGAAVS
jgi:hypothetical protein